MTKNERLMLVEMVQMAANLNQAIAMLGASLPAEEKTMFATKVDTASESLQTIIDLMNKEWPLS